MRPVACDAVIIEDGKVLLIRRGVEPFKGQWAIPGGRLEGDETAEECLQREAKEETGLDVQPEALVGVYSDPTRDPRKIIAITYLCRRVGGEVQSGDDAAEARWFPLNALPPLASDHGKMVQDALRLLDRNK